MFKIFLLIFAMAPAAQAGFHLEPYLGFAVSGDWKDDEKGDISMTNFGTKLGYQAPSGFQVGGDIQLGAGSYKEYNAGADIDAATAAFGAYVGYQSDSAWRAYLHYLFASAIVFDTTADPTYAGNGFKLGVGYSVLPWLAVNLEYHAMTYKKGKDDTVSDYQTLDPKFKNDFIFLAVSFPFNFGG